MLALQLVSPREPLCLNELPVPGLAADEARIRVAGCGVCHTDIGFWQDGVKTNHPLPLTLGHEISGTVIEAGASVRDWIGRDVIVPAVISCGACEPCRSGRGNICRRQIMPGNDIPGGFAEFITVPARGLCPVPPIAGYTLAELSVVADAVTTPYQAVVKSGLRAGELAVVIGAGGVGGYCVQIAAALGAKAVAIDIDPAKLELIGRHGAALTVDGRSEFKAIRDAIRSAAKSWNCPETGWKIFECSGSGAGQQTAFGLLTHGAVLMVVGFTLAKGEFRLSNLMAFDAAAIGTWGCPAERYPEALRLVAEGKITLKPFIEMHPLRDGARVLEDVAAHRIARRAILTPEPSA